MGRQPSFIAIAIGAVYAAGAQAGPFVPSNLLVSRTVYAGGASTVPVGPIPEPSTWLLMVVGSR